MRQNDRENEDACNTLSSAWHDGADAKLHRNLFSGFSIIHREDVQNQTIIFTNYSTTRCEGASIMTTRQRTYLFVFVGMMEELSTGTSQEVAHSLPRKDRPSPFPAPYALTPVRGTRSGTCGREAWHCHRASPDADRDGWLWTGPTLGWSN